MLHATSKALRREPNGARHLMYDVYIKGQSFARVHPVPFPSSRPTALRRIFGTCVSYIRQGLCTKYLISGHVYLISDEELVSQVGRVDEGSPVHLGGVNTGLLDRVLSRQGGQ